MAKTFKILSLPLVFLILLFPQATMSAPRPDVPQLLLLTQSGASLELDLRVNRYSAAELLRLASSLKDQATLTLIMSENCGLSISQCVQISKVKPGRVIFRF